jgi:hypothetical protein
VVASVVTVPQLTSVSPTVLRADTGGQLVLRGNFLPSIDGTRYLCRLGDVAVEGAVAGGQVMCVVPLVCSMLLGLVYLLPYPPVVYSDVLQPTNYSCPMLEGDL